MILHPWIQSRGNLTALKLKSLSLTVRGWFRLKFKKVHTVILCIFAEIIWLICLNLFRIGLNTLVPGGNQFVIKVIQECLVISVTLLLLKVVGKTDVLSQKGCGIGKGLIIGVFPLAINVFSGVVQLIGFSGKRILQPYLFVIFFILSVFLIGIAEELMFRGFIATLMIEKFGTGKRGIWRAAIVSAILFGCAHLSNLFSSAPVGVLIQVIAAATGGLLLTAVYFRSGNIWVVAIMHSCTDLAGGLISGLYGIKLTDTISNYKAIDLLPCAVSLIIVLTLLRKRKLTEIEKHFCIRQKAELKKIATETV